MGNVGKCSSCKTLIWWGITPAGNLMPIDPTGALYLVAPDEKGPLRIIVPRQLTEGGPRLAVTISALALVGDPLPLSANPAELKEVQGWTPHWATCPTMALHRKKKRSRALSRA